jgi:hypothetical protein
MIGYSLMIILGSVLTVAEKDEFNLTHFLKKFRNRPVKEVRR